MNFCKLIKLIFCLIILNFNSFSQNNIFGKIIDKQTKLPIIGASIRLNQSLIGTISNENGEFQILSNNPTNQIKVTHIAYQSLIIDINTQSHLEIFLNEAIITLPEVNVGNPSINLINLVIKKAIENKNNTDYYKSFYQKTSQINGKYNKIHEMFFEMSWNSAGVQSWMPLKSRYAEKNQQKYVYKNFIYNSFLKSGVLGKYSYFPINQNNPTNNYDFKIEKYLNIGSENEIAIIKCTPKKKFKNHTTFSGHLYIDTSDEILLNVNGTFTSEKNGKWKNRENIIINFDKVNKRATLKYIHLEFYATNIFAGKKNIESAWIYCIEKKTGFSNNKTFNIDEIDDDLSFFEKSKYSKNFWDSEVPILHTNLEKEIINYFEKKGSFKSNL